MMTKHERDLRAVKKIRAEEAQKIEEIWGREAKEDRQLSADEREEILDLTKHLDELRRQQDEIEANLALEQKVKEASTAMGPTETPSESAKTDIRVVNEPPPIKSVGEQFVQSKSYTDMFSDGVPQGNWKADPIELQTKATVTSGGTISGYGPYQSNVPGVIPIADQPLVVSDLMPQNTATAPQIQYFKERVATNAAAGVGEGAAKPESTFDFEASSASLSKIATFLPVSDEMLEDAPSIEAYLNNRLGMFVRTEEEQQLLRGAGSGSNEVEGFIDNYALNGVGSAVVVGTAAANAGTAIFGDLLKIMNNQRGSSYLDATDLIVHPNEFGTIRDRYDANGQYYGGGPILGQYGNNGQAPSSRLSSGFSLWGVNIHVTTQVGAGTMLLGNFRQGAAVWRRGGISVQASNSHSDYFQKNLTAIRAEERLALTVYRPEAFTVLTWA